MATIKKTTSITKGEKIANQIFNILAIAPIIAFAYYIVMQLIKLF